VAFFSFSEDFVITGHLHSKVISENLGGGIRHLCNVYLWFIAKNVIKTEKQFEMNSEHARNSF
jgi:hypothetical protein